MRFVVLCATFLLYCSAGAQAGNGPNVLQSPPVVPEPRDLPFHGVLELHVDATDTAHSIFRMKETIPLQTAEDLVLLYPEWDPGSHGPTSSSIELAGLQAEIDGHSVEWRRDVRNVNAFHITIPAYAHTLSLVFQYLSPHVEAELRPEMVVIPWQRLLLYPAGWYARNISVSATLTLSKGLRPFTALTLLPETGLLSGRIAFAPVTLDRLIDAPVYAARYTQQMDLTMTPHIAVHLDLVADTPREIAISPDDLKQLRLLVVQSEKVFGPPPFRHYDAIVSMSDELSPEGGIEHSDEGEIHMPANYLSAPAQQLNNRDLIAHEYVHAWNGRFRLPAGLWSPNCNSPTDPSLLWIYEGQTEFWGRVLAARAGMRDLQETLDKLALDASHVANRSGREWKTLADSTLDVLYMPGRPVAWRDWQRREDYYSEGVLLWLDVDAHLRELSKEKYGLDDFAHTFFTTRGRVETTVLYSLDDVCDKLNEIVPSDWKRFLSQHLLTHSTDDAIAGLARVGWKLSYTPIPTQSFLQEEADAGVINLDTSLGLQVSASGIVRSVAWNGPAFAVGLAPGKRIISINDKPFSRTALLDATSASKTVPVRLTLQEKDVQLDVILPYAGPLRYPHLERVLNTQDRLTPLLVAR